MKILMFAALSVASFAVPATAEPVTRSQRVTTSGLDLASAAGTARLDRRIHNAAIELCGTSSSIDLVGKNRLRRCIADARASAAGAQAAAVTRAATMTAAR